ncbi:DUF4265 domain-containing protein [Microbispora sp. NEAU-D428]|uniref:DUF4265 domain-containing protein n=1 Tax=Microbispora sitophila TaxID=2771537 RepID=UPI0018689F8D|nr:DUF4265 domain-containing protein [Microbispora sitophila]MBE3015004.1 DUF4265 domain-containing protein [Microbispora sitophila]
MGEENYVKVVFCLEQDEDGWPPAGSEALWAESTEDPHVVKLANTPFFALGVAWGDEVSVRKDSDGPWFYAGLVRESGHSAVRIIVNDRDRVGEFQDKLTEFGCAWEGISEFPGMIAVNVPPEVSYRTVRAWLDESEYLDLLDFEEGAVSRHHRSTWHEPGA